MTSDAILTQLRMLPGAPERLRERVRTLPEPQGRRVWAFPRVDARRTFFVLAPAVVAVALGGAVLHGVLTGGPERHPVAADAKRVVRAEEWRGATTTMPAYSPGSAGAGAMKTPAPALTQRATALPSSATRLNKYEAWLRVRVSRDDLSRNATRAMQIARGYGGYVASVDMNTPGQTGRAVLVLRVPVTHVEDAVLRLGKLGDVTAQHVRIQDLQRTANQQQDAILKLRTTIARLEARLAGTLLTGQRIELEFELAQARQSLAQKTKAHKSTVREGTLATISTTLFVEQRAEATPPGRLSRTLDDAGSFLVRELSWLLYALIVFGPVALLAAAIVLAVRSGRRRSDARLLESH